MKEKLKEGQLTKHFNKKEFACKCGCGKDDVHAELVSRLEDVRVSIGIPIRITSGCRCESHNKAVGGKPNSSHLKGLAVDLEVIGSNERFRFLHWLPGHFHRIGMAKNFIHVDIDESKVQNVAWVY